MRKYCQLCSYHSNKPSFCSKLNKNVQRKSTCKEWDKHPKKYYNWEIQQKKEEK